MQQEKRPRSSSLQETQNYIKNTQDKQNESLQEMVVTLKRIVSATEQQTELFNTFITLHEQTLKVLSKIAEVFSKET